MLEGALAGALKGIVEAPMKEEHRRAAALGALAPHLPEPERSAALREALDAARGIREEHRRAAALGALAPHLARLERASLYPLWRETIHVLASRTRKDLLADLEALQPVVVRLGGPQALVETFHAIQDVGRWWP